MEKIVNLKNTTNILINLEKAKDRLQDATQALEILEIPFTRFPAVEHNKGLIGCGLSHHHLLSQVKPNTLILEDDVGLTEDRNIEWKVPSEADAIYFGVSDHGYIRNQRIGYRGTVLVSQYNEKYKRVLNMCSTHAILYLTKKYIESANQVIVSCLQQGVPFDLGLASIHRHFTILTPNEPLFYQIGQAEFTNLVLKV